MLQHVHRPTTHRALQARGQRPRQAPPVKEARKSAIQRDIVAMLDGTRCTVKAFNDMRSIAPKKLKEDFDGIATRVRLATAEHAGAWDKILEWMQQHRSKRGDTSRQNDNLVALALVYAASRFKRPVADILRDIMRSRSAAILFPSTQ